MSDLLVLVLVLALTGLTTIFWAAVGVIRLLAAGGRRVARRHDTRPHPQPGDVAILMAAHNEALVLADALAAACRLVSPAQVYVISDGSADATADIARAHGVHVLELSPNRGKAGALAAGAEHFRLAETSQVVVLLDADTRLAADYLETGLPAFADPGVAAVAGHARSAWVGRRTGLRGRVLVAYRDRLYWSFQGLVKYGQAAARCDALAIVPGFASMYRSHVVSAVDLAAPGLVIEDFNMTFELHLRGLGRAAYHPGRAAATTQDPCTGQEYVKQIRRWSLGYWQTIRRHRRLEAGMPRATGRRFWAAATGSAGELLVTSVTQLLLPLLCLAALAAAAVVAVAGGTPSLRPLTLLAQPAAVVLIADYVLTIVYAVVNRRPSVLLLGLVFPALRMVDAVITVQTARASRGSASDGRWVSPTRRAVEPTTLAAVT